MASFVYEFVTKTYAREFVVRKSVRINLTVSEQVERYLVELSASDIHGSKPTEVASTLISREIEKLFKEGFLKLDIKKSQE